MSTSEKGRHPQFHWPKPSGTQAQLGETPRIDQTLNCVETIVLPLGQWIWGSSVDELIYAQTSRRNAVLPSPYCRPLQLDYGDATEIAYKQAFCSTLHFTLVLKICADFP